MSPLLGRHMLMDCFAPYLQVLKFFGDLWVNIRLEILKIASCVETTLAYAAR